MPRMNTRILLVTHAPLAQALRACAIHVFADSAADVLALDIAADESPEASLARATALLGESAAPVLVLTDVFGATPCNVAQRLVTGRAAQLVAGVNLPMLLRAVSYRHETLDAVAARAVVGGTQGVMAVGAAPLQNQSPRSIHDQDHHHHQQ
ncbi:PTS system mannose-specific EIIAB component [compost metagenome]